jgi:hypothetical protein
MLRVYSIKRSQRNQILPKDGIYSVVEGYDYILEYESDEILTNTVFIEDIPLSPVDFEVVTYNKIRTIKKKFFIDYFGYACLKVNKEEFIFNIKVEKFKLNEIEDIFTFLWSKEESLFKNFFSKSTKTIKFDKSGVEINNTSKYVLFANYFVDTFEAMLQSFKFQPHSKLKNIRKEEDFSNSQISQYSIDWLFNNLDTLNFCNVPSTTNSTIEINNQTAVIEKIGTEEKINSYNTYENAIIVGALQYLKIEIQKLKKGIASIVNVETLQNKEFAEFSDLKKIPFLQMYQESVSIEKRCNRLIMKYQRVFRNIPTRIEKPQLTSVFSSKIHYRKAYKLIKKLFNYRFVLDGEFRLLNITKLSQLYEVYNFHILTDAIKAILNEDSFNYESNSSRKDGLSDFSSFTNSSFTVKLYYENSISNGDNNKLIRIDKRKGSYYKPDYILEISKVEGNINLYWILDSKYSKQAIVKSHHLNECMYKYLLNTGVLNHAYKKPEGLALLFPSGTSSKFLESNYYRPTIDMIVSKPKSESDLFNYISDILKSNLSNELINVTYR